MINRLWIASFIEFCPEKQLVCGNDSEQQALDKLSHGAVPAPHERTPVGMTTHVSRTLVQQKGDRLVIVWGVIVTFQPKQLFFFVIKLLFFPRFLLPKSSIPATLYARTKSSMRPSGLDCRGHAHLNPPENG
jgi:hypothetical protein